MGMISDEHLEKVCKMGPGAATCSYVGLGPAGFECQKGTPMQAAIDQRRAAGKMVAMGDNCGGVCEMPWISFPTVDAFIAWATKDGMDRPDLEVLSVQEIQGRLLVHFTR